MFLPGADTGIRAIIAADRRFDVNQFAEGAKSAYRMVLEAFWKGDREERGYLCDADVHASFVQAIDASEAEGQKLETRLLRIEKMQIDDASVNGSIASITLRFEHDNPTVTPHRDGNDKLKNA